MNPVRDKVYVVIPNWNGADKLPACLDSLKSQTVLTSVIVVDNASGDGSAELLEEKYPEVILIENKRNLGFAGGVNTGIRHAIEADAKYVTLLNNDAVAEEDWLEHLISFMDKHPQAGIVTSKIVDKGGNTLDSTGDLYTIWGLPYPRGREEPVGDKYDDDIWVFGASGGASLYRIKMLRQIGLFDEDFFAYYEDVDISFRAQLAGWKVAYEPKSIVHHEIGATSSQIKGFATYHTIKNLPLLLWKNVPWRLMLGIWFRFALAWSAIVGRALARGQIWPVAKGIFMGAILWPRSLIQRYKIQKNRKVSVEYISSIITRDLPPNATKLRKLRGGWWRIIGKHHG